MTFTLPLMKFLGKVGSDRTEQVKKSLAEEGVDTPLEELEVKRARTARDIEDLDDAERTVIQYVSTRTLDRDGDVILPKGIILTDYLKNPTVLWGHDYSQPPIGSDDWIKADDFGLIARTRYATTERADEIWTLKKEGHLRTNSIGFIPLARTMPGHADWEKTVRKLESDWPEFAKSKDNVKSVITRAMLLEHSDVSVPSNPDSLVLAVSKGSLWLSPSTIEQLGIKSRVEEKTQVEPEPEQVQAQEEAEEKEPAPEQQKDVEPAAIPAEKETRSIEVVSVRSVEVVRTPRFVEVVSKSLPEIINDEILKAKGRV